MLLKIQRGYAIITMTIILLLGISITAFIAARSMRFEQTEENNDMNQQLAFQAAEAGLEYGIGYLFANKSTVIADANGDGFIDGATNSSLNNVAFNNNTTYRVTFMNPIANNFSIVMVTSKGTANNGASTHTVYQLLKTIPFVPTTPPAALIAKSSVSLGGNVTVTVGNPDGATIWSGSSVSLSGSASTAGHSGLTSSKSGIKADVIQQDTGIRDLSNDLFFSGFFGQSKTTVQQASDLVYNYSSNSNLGSTLNGVTGKSIWVNQNSGKATLNGNTTIGSASQPVVLIVKGPLDVSGNVTIYGMVYIIGEWNNEGSGNLTINGSVVVEGSVSSVGTPTINYSNAIISKLGQIGTFSKVPGSWRDF